MPICKKPDHENAAMVCHLCYEDVVAQLVDSRENTQQLQLQIDAWRPVLQAAIYLIGKNVSRPGVFKDAGDVRKYELAVALSKMGDEQRKEMESLTASYEALRAKKCVHEMVREFSGACKEHRLIDCRACAETTDLPPEVPLSREELKTLQASPFKAPSEKRIDPPRNAKCAACGHNRENHDYSGCLTWINADANQPCPCSGWKAS